MRKNKRTKPLPEPIVLIQADEPRSKDELAHALALKECQLAGLNDQLKADKMANELVIQELEERIKVLECAKNPVKTNKQAAKEKERVAKDSSLALENERLKNELAKEKARNETLISENKALQAEALTSAMKPRAIKFNPEAPLFLSRRNEDAEHIKALELEKEALQEANGQILHYSKHLEAEVQHLRQVVLSGLEAKVTIISQQLTQALYALQLEQAKVTALQTTLVAATKESSHFVVGVAEDNLTPFYTGYSLGAGRSESTGESDTQDEVEENPNV